MFPEHRELISQLRQSDTHFRRLFDQHNDLDHKIKNLETGNDPGAEFEVDKLKKEKLKLKDGLYAIIKKTKTE